jgi:hypothetical protein
MDVMLALVGVRIEFWRRTYVAQLAIVMATLAMVGHASQYAGPSHKVMLTHAPKGRSWSSKA